MGPDSQRPVHGPCELKCCERTPEDKTYDIYLAPWKSPTGRLTLWDNGKLGLGQRSRMTERSPMGRLTLWDNGKLALGCIDRGKKHDLGRPRGVQREGLHCGTTGSWDSGVQIWDGQCCERTLDELPTDGLWNDKSVCLICV